MQKPGQKLAPDQLHVRNRRRSGYHQRIDEVDFCHNYYSCEPLTFLTTTCQSHLSSARSSKINNAIDSEKHCLQPS
ncbi:hypothetical protein CaCOL14_006971 [Colletotrichum acutatum]